MYSLYFRREYDVPFHMRVAIDKEIFAGHWYTVKPTPGGCTTPEIRLRSDIVGWPVGIFLPHHAVRPNVAECAEFFRFSPFR